MAFFDFECNKCGEFFEEEQSLFEIEIGHEILCPECSGFTTKLFIEGIKCKHGSWSEWRLSFGNKD